ncbi:MAG: hypothetical protein KAT78_05120, partial [Flavobacteriaceae bacterium]|nr:hypothetical protein [Flavobacteriaceae bacterium]
VLHIPNPLALYYSRFTEVNRPNSIVLITKNPVSFERILRVTKKINESKSMTIHSAKCEVNIGSRKYSGIRVKGIERYTDIEEIQKDYISEGFEFRKNERVNNDTKAIIRVNKFFNLNEVGDGIYQSPNNNDRFYIEISKDMNWDMFRDLTFDIKNNVSVTNYDIAKGIFYKNDGIADMLRVIKPNITLEMVKEIQQKYLDRLS